MSLKIYLLRHGETSYSQNGTYCGSIDPGLTVEGSQMAQAFANTYKCLSWVQVFVSPQQRAISTAQPLCDVINLPMQIKNGLREIITAHGKVELRKMFNFIMGKSTFDG